MNGVLDRIAAQRVVPVIRAASAAEAVTTVRAFGRAGLRVVELTRSVPDVDRVLEELRGDGLILGVGTITSIDEIHSAAAAGARFVVSFTCPAGFVQHANKLGLLPIPGGFTPTEIAACARAGAPAVKLFPARLATPAYLGDLRAVLPTAKLIVTGGIRPGDVDEWLASGALAVGLGSLGVPPVS